ncbi:MAG: hypothetical protein GX969_00845 [Firmicutes bacterium]|nr:hypothetical protein [Bacillota bacterium]
MASVFREEYPELTWYETNMPRLAIILGIIAIVIGLFAQLPRTKGLYMLIAIGPILAGIVAYARSEATTDIKRVADIIIQATWIMLSFGCAYFVMAPSEYYSARGGLTAIILIVAGIMVVFAIATLVAFGRKGFELTP